MVQRDNEEKRLIDLKELTILLVGDPGVGKTSLIQTLVEGEFKTNLPARIPPVNLSANVLPDHVPLKIVDYSERDQTNCSLRQLVEDADVICIVYLAGDSNSLDRVKSHWVRVIRQHQTSKEGKYKPIIVAANKADLKTESEVKSSSRIPPVLQEIDDIEASIDVSALTQKNVIEVFYLAQKAVLYPLGPLFDSHLRVLTKKCRNALIHIFKLCDLDEDGLLSDHELNLFHENCFGIPLQKDALLDLKSIIKQSTMDGILDNSITQSGFLFLHTFSIDKGRHAFTWRVLRKFNYDNHIEPKTVSEETNIDLVNEASQNGNSELCKSRSGSKEVATQQINHLDLVWLRENSKLIKTGFGVTVATIVSMLALKYLIQGGSRV